MLFLDLDLSPHYVGYFYSIGNSIANISGVLGPIVAGHILGEGNDDRSHRQHAASSAAWRRLFYITAAVYFAAMVIWVAFSKGKPLQALN